MSEVHDEAIARGTGGHPARRMKSSWALTRVEKRYGARAETVASIVAAPLIQPTRASYRRYLCDLYGFIVAFEARLAYAYTLDLRFIQERIKSGRMASDLLSLGLSPYERVRLSQRCVVPRFDTAYKALGWLFVVERMMRELPAIRRRLCLALPSELEVAGQFLGTPEIEIETSWDELGRVIDRHVHAQPELDATLLAVHAALQCLEEWVLLPATSSASVDTEQLRFP
ncbi:MAG TPA: hypothetical protein VMZ53_04355 [Kofleriaceae bacterium]|nr:hypothetical protein [Kofleriaceae bacterium]